MGHRFHWLFVALLVAGFLLPAAAADARTPPPWHTGESRGEDIRIVLLTFSVGDAIASWFGHSAILVEDSRLKVQRVYNYGMFSFGPDLLPKFLMGRLEFWVGEASLPATISLYRSLDRDIRAQELNLTPDKRLEIAEFMAWNVLPENRDYLYHHYWDNCSTRVRDVIDQATDGQFEEVYHNSPAEYSLREHTRRHTQRNPYIDVLLTTWMNDDIDEQITEWDVMFLPIELEERVDDFTYVNPNGERVPLVKSRKVIYDADRPPAPEEPSTMWPWTLLLGVLFGGIAIGLARWHHRSDRRLPRVMLGLHHVLAGLLFGLPGLVMFVFPVTDHVITYWNENNLLLSIPTFLALPFGMLIAVGRRRPKLWMKWCWYLMTFTSFWAVALKVLPAFDQGNWITISLMMPVNLGFAIAMSRFRPRPQGIELERIDDGLWTSQIPHTFFGVDLGARMTVLRLSDATLWLHSPVAMTPELKAQVDELGEVGHIVAPNRFHHVYVGEWEAAYPDAEVWGAPGLDTKRSDIDFDHVLGDTPPDVWSGELEQLLLRGAPLINEVVFFHPKTHTLISCDLALNLDPDSAITRFYIGLTGKPGEVAVTKTIRTAFKDHGAVRASVDEILEWDFERMVLSHGAIVEDDAREKLRSAYEWL